MLSDNGERIHAARQPTYREQLGLLGAVGRGVSRLNPPLGKKIDVWLATRFYDIIITAVRNSVFGVIHGSSARRIVRRQFGSENSRLSADRLSADRLPESQRFMRRGTRGWDNARRQTAATARRVNIMDFGDFAHDSVPQSR